VTRQLGGALSALVVGLAVVSCGITATDSVEEIGPEELAGLTQTDAPAPTGPIETDVAIETTTVGGAETTTPAGDTHDSGPEPPGSDPAQTDATAPPATSPVSAPADPTIPSESVEVYFIDGSRVAAFEIDLPRPVSLIDHLAGLAVGPDPHDAEAGVRTAVPDGLVSSMRIRGAEVTVDLDGAVLNGVEPPDQVQLFGQIVLTLTGPMGFEAVMFTVDGRPARVFRDDNSLSEAGQGVTRPDYEDLLAPR